LKFWGIQEGKTSESRSPCGSVDWNTISHLQVPILSWSLILWECGTKYECFNTFKF